MPILLKTKGFQMLKSLIRTIPDYPKPGIMFRDITTLLSHPDGLKETVEQLKNNYLERDIDVVAGIEARGFILGAALSYALGKGFVPVVSDFKRIVRFESGDFTILDVNARYTIIGTGHDVRVIKAHVIRGHADLLGSL